MKPNGKGNGHDKQAQPDLLSYPSRVHIKAIGKHSVRFEALVHSIVSKHISPDDLLASSSRESRGGKYLSVTLTITANSREQLDKIYRELSGCEDVLIAL